MQIAVNFTENKLRFIIIENGTERCYAEANIEGARDLVKYTLEAIEILQKRELENKSGEESDKGT